mgnify:FL=1
MEVRKAKMIVNTSGAGSSTFRATLPSSWVREMGLDEEKRNLKLYFDGERIIIKNNEEEIRMLKKLLGLAKVEIEKEMNRLGYIDDSDYADRFLDELAKNLVKKELVPDGNLDLYYEKEAEIEELIEELLKMIKDEVMINYDSIGTTNERGDYSGCWYRDLKGLVNWADTWQENSLQEAYEEFINAYDVDITLEQFAEAYEVDLEDYLDE